jgi:hypothetical protein
LFTRLFRAVIIFSAAAASVTNADAEPIVYPHFRVELPDPVERFESESDTAWGAAKEVQHSGHQDDVALRVVAVLPKKPVKNAAARLPRVLEVFRKHHKCVAEKTTSFAAAQTLKGVSHLTFAGICAGGDRYVIRVLTVGDEIYELHADVPMRGPGQAQLNDAFERLLKSVEIK